MRHLILCLLLVACTAEGETGPAGREGLDGMNGADGANGQDGARSLLRLDAEPAGANCAVGGVAVRAGLDGDADDELEDAEVDANAFVCHGADGRGPLLVRDGGGGVVGELAGMEGTYGRMNVRDAAGNVWSMDGNGSFDNSLNARFYFTSNDCTGTAHTIPSAIGYMVSDGTNVYRYAGALATTQTYLSELSRTGCGAVSTTTGIFAAHDLHGALPASATPPFTVGP